MQSLTNKEKCDIYIKTTSGRNILMQQIIDYVRTKCVPPTLMSKTDVDGLTKIVLDNLCGDLTALNGFIDDVVAHKDLSMFLDVSRNGTLYADGISIYYTYMNYIIEEQYNSIELDPLDKAVTYPKIIEFLKEDKLDDEPDDYMEYPEKVTIYKYRYLKSLFNPVQYAYNPIGYNLRVLDLVKEILNEDK